MTRKYKRVKAYPNAGEAEIARQFLEYNSFGLDKCKVVKEGNEYILYKLEPIRT